MDEKTRKDTSCEMDELMRGSSEYSNPAILQVIEARIVVLCQVVQALAVLCQDNCSVVAYHADDECHVAFTELMTLRARERELIESFRKGGSNEG